MSQSKQQLNESLDKQIQATEAYLEKLKALKSTMAASSIAIDMPSGGCPAGYYDNGNGQCVLDS